MSITTGKTVKDAIAELAAIVPRLDVLRDDEATAKDNCDDALVASIKELREQLLCEHAEAFAVIGEVRDGRRARVCRAPRRARCLRG